MADPITWRNVNSTVSPSGGRGLLAGQAAVRDAFGVLGNLLGQQRDMQVANAKVQREANTQDYLDAVGGATAEQLADPNFVAGLEAQRTAQGNALDRAATRAAIDNRRASLQDSALATQKYDDMQAEVGQRGIVDSLLTQAAAGDQAGVEATLANTELLNEGQVRNQLNQILDNRQQREYRAAGEARAQASAQRAVESHALSMQQGRENLAYTREARADASRDRNDANLADSAVLEALNQREQAEASSRENLRNIAKDQGLPVGADGLPDVSRMTEEQRTSFDDEMAKTAPLNNLTDTGLRQGVIKMLRDGGAGAKAIERASQQLDIVEKSRALAPADRQRLEAQVQSLNAPLDAQRNELVKTYEANRQRNPFIDPSKDPVGDVNNIMKGLTSKGLSNEKSQREVNNFLLDVATNGITLPNGEKRVVPTSVIQNALNTADVENGWLTFRTTPKENAEKAIKALMASDGMLKLANEAGTLRDNYVRDLNNIDNKKLSNTVKLTNGMVSNNGGTIGTNDILSASIRRREQRGD